MSKDEFIALDTALPAADTIDPLCGDTLMKILAAAKEGKYELTVNFLDASQARRIGEYLEKARYDVAYTAEFCDVTGAELSYDINISWRCL